jgi:hypothetical protein
MLLLLLLLLVSGFTIYFPCIVPPCSGTVRLSRGIATPVPPYHIARSNQISQHRGTSLFLLLQMFSDPQELSDLGPSVSLPFNNILTITEYNAALSFSSWVIEGVGGSWGTAPQPYMPPRPVTGIVLLYGDGVCFLWGTNWTVSTATSSQYLAVNCEPIV